MENPIPNRPPRYKLKDLEFLFHEREHFQERKPPLTPEQEEIISAMKLFQSQIPKIVAHEMAKNSQGARACLCYLYDKVPSTTAKELSDVLGVSTARVTMLLNKLEENAYLQRFDHPKDGRIKIVALTPLGIQKAQECKRLQYETMKDIINIYPIEELTKLFDQLNTIHNIIQTAHEEEEEFP